MHTLLRTRRAYHATRHVFADPQLGSMHALRMQIFLFLSQRTESILAGTGWWCCSVRKILTSRWITGLGDTNFGHDVQYLIWMLYVSIRPIYFKTIIRILNFLRGVPLHESRHELQRHEWSCFLNFFFLYEKISVLGHLFITTIWLYEYDIIDK